MMILDSGLLCGSPCMCRPNIQYSQYGVTWVQANMPISKRTTAEVANVISLGYACTAARV